ncbi:von Willebrand factor C and EGF domain-containing protein isoform X2 [Pleurodeles waltl]|uniref:von Willebrand factor C and EGF domain-containing protein isoform X2 n=1 Tax=Pleurodeles waltl TaxID=8319 RepID=UPI003709534C
MLWKSLLQVSCLFLCTGLTRGRIYSARKKPAGSALQRNRFGPHMCHSAVGAGIGCCPGWAPSPITGLCVIPLCSFGCGSGSCIAPNVCSCRGGQQSISCPDDGAATGFLSQYAEVSPGKTSSSCLSAMCEQSCLLISGSPVCSCFHGYSLSKDGRSCYVPGGCGEYGCTLTCNHGGCEHISRVCPPGFTMREMENGVTCIDIDECETASCDGICLNTDGGFVCECRPGMQLSADRQSCVDIDECSANRALCQQKCRNSYGSYKCLCSTGFTLHGNGHSCIDVNECRRPSGARLCQHSCQNTFGSFLCACRVGFQLHVDKVSCNDVDECSLSFDHTTSPCRHLCTNTFGSYRCSCHQGYQLASDGHSCEELTDLGATLSLMFSSHKDALPTTFLPPYPQAFMTLPQVTPSSPPSQYFFPSPGTVQPPQIASLPKSPSHSSPLTSSVPLTSKFSLQIATVSTPTPVAPKTNLPVSQFTTTHSQSVHINKSNLYPFLSTSFTSISAPPTPSTKYISLTLSTTVLPLTPLPATSTTQFATTTHSTEPSSPTHTIKSPLTPVNTVHIMTNTGPLLTTLISTVSTTTHIVHTQAAPFTATSSVAVPTTYSTVAPFTTMPSPTAPTTMTHLAPLSNTVYPPLAQKASKISQIALSGDSSQPTFLQPPLDSPINLLSPGTQLDSSAPPPTSCLHQEVLHVDGSLWTEAGCLHCTCQAGIVLCDNVTCSVPCSHPVPMPDECCPSCEGCLFEGIERTEGDVFPPTVDDCIVCICIAGNVTCINPDCPDITCQNPVMSDCCLRCPAECFFHGETFPHGAEFSRDGDKCSSCICRNGEVECFFAPCPTLDCPREDWLLEPGQCCFRCQEFQTVTGCPVDDNGIEFPIGQIWSPGDPCEICVCQADSSVVCKRTDCVETCPHPILIPGQCCPDCSAGCSYGRIVVQNNESFPSPSDSCLTCICLFGSVACSPRECTVSCTYPFHAEGECCPICRDCTYEGRKVLDGQAFLMEKEPCTQCTCQSGEVNCEEITCQVSCSEPYTPPGECCATCSECLYEDQVLEDGGYYVSKADPCILCYCEAGNVHCDWRGDSCPLLVCEQPPVHAAGTCCPVCPEDDELPLDSHILSHFEEMEPMKYFRNPRGVTNQLVKAVNALTPATYPKEQSKLRKLILRRKSRPLGKLDKLPANKQNILFSQNIFGLPDEHLTISEQHSTFSATVGMGTWEMFTHVLNSTVLGPTYLTASTFLSGIEVTSSCPTMAPTVPQVPIMQPISSKITYMPRVTPTNGISTMSLFRLGKLPPIPTTEPYSISTADHFTSIASTASPAAPSSLITTLMYSMFSKKEISVLPLSSPEIFMLPMQLLDPSVPHTRLIVPSRTISAGPYYALSTAAIPKHSLSPTVRSPSVLQDEFLSSSFSLTSVLETLMPQTHAHDPLLPSAALLDASGTVTGVLGPFSPTKVCSDCIPPTNAVGHSLLPLIGVPPTFNTLVFDSSLPPIGTSLTSLQSSRTLHAMEEPDEKIGPPVAALERSHKHLVLQSDQKMQRRGRPSG